MRAAAYRIVTIAACALLAACATQAPQEKPASTPQVRTDSPVLGFRDVPPEPKPLLASPLDLVYSFIKSLLFGAAIGVIACYHGLNPRGHSINVVPQAAIRAVTEALLAVMLLNVVFAYMVYGVTLVGLIQAEQ